MTLITRPADEFEPGDRVYDTETNTINIAYNNGKTWLTTGGWNYGLDRKGKGCGGRFLRVVEPGETIPKGAVTKPVFAHGLGTEYKWPSEFTIHSSEGELYVLVSLPEPEKKWLGTDFDADPYVNEPEPAEEPVKYEVCCAHCRAEIYKLEQELDEAREELVMARANQSVSPDAILQAAATIYALSGIQPVTGDRSDWAANKALEMARLITQTKANA